MKRTKLDFLAKNKGRQNVGITRKNNRPAKHDECTNFGATRPYRQTSYHPLGQRQRFG
jgi:hypothetical protein